MTSNEQRLAELKSRRQDLTLRLRTMEDDAATSPADRDYSAISRTRMLIDQIDDEVACFRRSTQI